MAKEILESWSVNKSAELYGINNWSSGYFNISKEGELRISLKFDGKVVSIPFRDVISGLSERGFEMPILLRIQNLLEEQITRLNESFRHSIKEANYQGEYRGVFPIKVNQQQQVIEEVTQFGKRYHHGLEAGSKAELIAALAMLDDKEACLICNGYKDAEFVDLGLEAVKMGYKCFFVLEMPGELDLIIERSRVLNIKPLLGVRIKLSSQAGGHWTESGGDRSIFGLNSSQLIQVIDRLKDVNMLDSLRLLHFHLGSQIPNIRDIRQAVFEGARYYADLVQEGAPMGYLDIGGGLAVDYDGSQTNYMHSKNYTLDEYATDIIEVIISVLDVKNIPHPTLVSESGRNTVAFYSVLLVNILDVAKTQPADEKIEIRADAPELLKNLKEVQSSLNIKNTQESLNDALYYREEIREQFRQGKIVLRHRAQADHLYYSILHKIKDNMEKMKRIPSDLEGLSEYLSDIYYANFSVFQSIPDAWAIGQVFPIMPLHRLNEKPDREAILADITCDCDGKIDRFIDVHDEKKTLPLHSLTSEEEYYLGFFLVGAYQETLGDLHNLLGDTNVVTIRINKDGSFDYSREIEGDTIADVLSYVEFEPKNLQERFRIKAEKAVKEGFITASERKDVVNRFENGLRGYTYFER